MDAQKSPVVKFQQISSLYRFYINIVKKSTNNTKIISTPLPVQNKTIHRLLYFPRHNSDPTLPL